MAAITEFVRKLIRDVETDVLLREVSDAEIDEVVRASLATVDKARLRARYSHERKIFHSEFGHRFLVDGVVEVEITPTPILYSAKVFQREASGDLLLPQGEYSVDALAGLVYFPVERTHEQAATMYVTYSYCEPYYVASELLLSLAAEYAQMAFRAQSATFKLEYDRAVESLTAAAEAMQARGGLQVGTLVREDRVGG